VVKLDLHRLDAKGWRGRFESAGFTAVRTERVFERRGAESVECDACTPDDEARKALQDAGTLWIHGEKLSAPEWEKWGRSP